MNAIAGVPEIEIAGVTKQYGNAHAVLESIDLVVAKQEFISIIGPSGCGKSTILKLIAGLAVPTSGTIRVDGMTPQNAQGNDFLRLSGRDVASLAHGESKISAWAWSWSARRATGGKKRLPPYSNSWGSKM